MCKLNVIPVEHQHIKIVIVSLVAFSLNSCTSPASQLACPKTQSLINWDCLGLMGVFIQTCPRLGLWSQQCSVFSFSSPFLLFLCSATDCSYIRLLKLLSCIPQRLSLVSDALFCFFIYMWRVVSSLFNNQRFSVYTFRFMHKCVEKNRPFIANLFLVSLLK